jgi:hypothetical protein
MTGRQTTRETWITLRRLYRAAWKMSAMDKDAPRLRVLATSAIRTATHRWDCCQPQHSNMWATPVRVGNRTVCYRWPVTNTAQAFFRRTR